MSRIIFFITPLFLISFFKGNAQQENVWAFGDSAGIDFNGKDAMAIKTSIRGFGEASASVCDNKGNLLFYTEGSFVWNRKGILMPNGNNLTGLANNNTLLTSITSSTTQGALIVPMPGHPNLYYIFSLTSQESGYYGKLYYSIVDMNLNAGLGDVVNGQKGILLDSTSLNEKMTAIVGDHCDVWLLVHVQKSNTFRAWKITSAGIGINPVISNSGNFLYYDVGVLKGSPGRKKLVACSLSAGLELYSFDPATGVIYKAEVLDNNYYYGAAFSSDNSKLYASDGNSIYQFDLTVLNPSASKTYIGEIGFSDMKLAPNGKIYFLSGGTLGTINFPNLNGDACGYTENAMKLLSGTRIYAGFPNVIPIIHHDTFLSSNIIKADCWINIYQLSIQTPNDTTAWDYIWNDGTYGRNKIADTPGIYWVTYHTPPCNYHIDTFHVSFPNGVLPDIHTQNACKEFDNGKAWATTYPGDTVTYHYCWQSDNGDTLSLADTLQNVPSGNYTLRVSTAHCDTTLSFFIPEEEHHVSFLADSIVCQGTEVLFQNTSDSSFTRFLWDFGDSGDTGLRSPDHIYKHAGNYRITLIGEGKICTDTVYKTITVDSLFSGTFLTEPDSICAGEEAVSFYPQTDSSALNLHWQFGDGSEMISGNEEKVQHAYEMAGNLRVQLTTQFRACPDTSFTDTVYVYPLPKVDLGPDTSLCLNASPIILQNREALATGNYHYQWSTGDTTEKIKVVHPGIYHLTINKEPLNCSNSASIRITKDCYMDIPNAFTPNGNGENNYFFPRQLLSKRVTQFHMQIFNRWGELIFETSKINGRGWDGKFNGKPQPEGVYVYLIDAGISGNKSEHYEGNITLLR